MSKRELSSTLRNLKFMQRAIQKEEKNKMEEEATSDGNFPSSNIPKKCVVIMEGDPHPGAMKGRMSFQNFNASIDKLNGEQENLEASAVSCADQSGISASCGENGFTEDGSEVLSPDGLNSDGNGDLKRKQMEVVSEVRYPNKSQKNGQGNKESLPNNTKGSRKQSKREKLDWSVLKPPKYQNKRG